MEQQRAAEPEGHEYTEDNEQFDDVQLIMHSINDACLIARVTFADDLEVHFFTN